MAFGWLGVWLGSGLFLALSSVWTLRRVCLNCLLNVFLLCFAFVAFFVFFCLLVFFVFSVFSVFHERKAGRERRQRDTETERDTWHTLTCLSCFGGVRLDFFGVSVGFISGFFRVSVLFLYGALSGF